MTSAWLKIPSVAKSNFNIKMKFNNIPQMPFIKKLNELNLKPVLKLDKITFLLFFIKLNEPYKSPYQTKITS